MEAHDFTTLAEDMALVIERRNIKERCQKIIYKEIAEDQHLSSVALRHLAHDTAYMMKSWQL
ncbi:hypothetical protein IVY21_06985 [Salmonella enterica subsp. enterica serovar Worthington]|nr:hypothetical protein [Salmonella enterica subsp. enterica serovar Worthington]